MATPSQQTNQILELIQQLESGQSQGWGELAQLCEARLQGQQQNRQEFESKAQVRGEAFLEQARTRLEMVKKGFDQYATCLVTIGQSAQTQDSQRLTELSEQLKESTQKLFAELDGYAAFYFAWGENQSPLVTMIRHAVESYSRGALQSAQAQRILSEMNEHFSAQSETKEGEA
ncbi:MAG: hypothetical protein U0931_04055 [Vulcanimicrobiota bacterium]